MVKFIRLVRDFAFRRYLPVTNITGYASLVALGDMTSQQMEKNMTASKKPHDWGRTRRLLILGFVMGTVNFTWYRILDRTLPGTKWKTIFKKMLVDQSLGAPIQEIIYFTVGGVLDRHSIKDSIADYRKKFFEVYSMDCMLWLPAQFINFTYVPPHMRVLYDASVTFFWNIFLSYMKHRDFHYVDLELQTTEPVVVKAIV